MKKFVLALSLFLLFACGKSVTPYTPPIPVPLNPTVKATVLTFGAYNCSICSRELPDLDAYFEQNLRQEAGMYEVITYVVDARSQDSADNYGEKLGLSFKMFPDFRCREYGKYFQGACMVPATVLLDKDGNVVKNFGKGTPNFQDLTALIKKTILK